MQYLHCILFSGYQANKVGRNGMLSRDDLKHAIKAFTDIDATDELLQIAIERFCKNKNSSGYNISHSNSRSSIISTADNININNTSTMMSYSDFKQLLLSGLLQPSYAGRYWVGISLSEAETIRRIIHIRNNKNNMSTSYNSCDSNSISNIRSRSLNSQNIIPGFNTEIALRYNPTSENGIFDCSMNFKTVQPTRYESSVVHNSFRFFDCDMHFSFPAINVLIKTLRSPTAERERFFLSTIGCRRRMERKWQETPLAKVFTIADEWISLKQKAQVVYILEALKDMNVTLWEAFTIFDFDNNGLISPAELYGGLIWLQMPNMTPDDVLDFFELADLNRDGMIDYKEYMDLFTIMDNHDNTRNIENSDEIGSHDNTDAISKDNEIENYESTIQNKPKNNFIKVEPYGTEILRELIIQRKLKEQNRIREERLRKQVYAEELDIKIFEEELQASKLRKGGANPLVTTNCHTIMPVVDNTAKQLSTTIATTVSLSSTNSTSCADDIKGKTIIDFRFTTNQHPLRFNAIGKSSFLPIHLGTAANHPLKPMKCDKNHELKMYNYYWQDCNRCKIR